MARFRIVRLEARIAPAAAVLGFNAHHDTVVVGGGDCGCNVPKC